ncbi:hypothetical protein [Rathayibacter rathayi]|uniref:hypothetical protein n=1 Tax=Rathayibacter rathayi TaxID=33887 RepID=UPI0011AFD5FF|nr:hypothetical protein [Rathayibacter rathayi]
MQDFEGPSAQVSWFAHLTQESNRSRPDSALFTLSEMVLVAIVQADAERERLSTLAAWEARQAEREEQRRLDPTGGAAFPLASSAFSLFGGTRSRNPVSSGTPPERRSSPSPLPGPRSSWGRSSLSGPPDSVDAASDLHVEAIDAGQARNKLPFETESGDETAWVGRQYSRDH